MQSLHNIAQVLRIRKIFHSYPARALRSIHSQTQQPLPVHPVHPKRPCVSIQQVVQEKRPGPIHSQVNRSTDLSLRIHACFACLEECSEDGRFTRAVVVIEIGVLGEGGPVDVDEDLHAFCVDGVDKLGEVTLRSQSGVRNACVDNRAVI